MSYSFSFKAPSKAVAKQMVDAKLAEILAQQASHEADHKQALAAAAAFIDVLEDDDTRDVSISMNGSVGWSGTHGMGHRYTSASISFSAYYVMRDTPA